MNIAGNSSVSGWNFWRGIMGVEVFVYSVMPNHWHFVVRPETSNQVSEFFRRLTVMHTMRWHAHYETGGTGQLYERRFESFPIQSDGHLLTVMRNRQRVLVDEGRPVWAHHAER